MFRRLETFLERLVEAPAGRLGAAPQPVTLAKRIERAMDTNKRFSGEGVIVPNRYVLHLNPADYAPFESYHGSLEDDLAHDALTRSRRLGYRLLARPTVVLTVFFCGCRLPSASFAYVTRRTRIFACRSTMRLS